MKRQWLRGALLGVSLALLLAGGVAMAAGLYVTVEKPCVECVYREGPDPGEENLIDIEFGGWDVGDYMCMRWSIDSSYWLDNCNYATTAGPVKMTDMLFPCGQIADGGVDAFSGEDLGALVTPISLEGEHTIRISREDPPGTEVATASASFVVAEDCSAYEFVPEPGSVLLLGSGLAGLAGYASLKLRAR